MRPDLPGPVPLPDDVRARALDTVLAGLDEPPRRSRRGLLAPLAVAAAVVAALVGSVTVATGLREQPPVLVPAAPAAPAVPVPGTPAPGSPDDALLRCTRADGAAAPGAGRVTAVEPLGVDTVIVVDGTRPCLATPDSVAPAPPRGTPMGEASVVRLAPSVLAVLNPGGVTVDVAEVPGVQTRGAPDAAVRLVLLPGVEVPEIPVTVEGSFDGLLPAPAPVAAVRDRVLPERAPGSADANDLEACVSSRPAWEGSRRELWQPVLRHEPGDGRPPVLLARIADLHAGFCTLAPDGPDFTWATLAPDGPVLVAPSSEWDGALLAVPEGTRSVEVAGARCSVADGLGFCTGVGEGATAVLRDDAGGRTEVPLG